MEVNVKNTNNVISKVYKDSIADELGICLLYTSGDKIKYGILKSCEKRPVSVEQIEEIVAFIENEINKHYISEIETEKIGEMVMDKLKDVDEVAYVRLDVYKRQSISYFRRIIYIAI